MENQHVDSDSLKNLPPKRVVTENPRTLTLILLNWEDYEKRRTFMKSQHKLKKYGWIPEVLFADSRYSDAKATGNQVANLIRNSKSDVVAILEEGLDTTEHLVSWLADISNSDIHCIFRRDRANKSATKFCLQNFNSLSRMLLRIGKTQFKPGMVAFRRGETVAAWSETPDNYSMTNFLAKARLNLRVVHETELSPRKPASVPIKTRHVNGATRGLFRFWWNQIMFPKQQGVHLQAANQPKYQEPMSALSRSERRLGWCALILTTLIALWLCNNGVVTIGTLATAATVFTTLAIGKRLVGFRAALIGAFCVLASTSVLFACYASLGDAVVTGLTTIVFLTSYLAIFRNNFSVRWWVVAASAAAVGVLIKGPVVLLVCLPPVIAACWLAENRAIREAKIWVTFSLTCGVVWALAFAGKSLATPETIQFFTTQMSADVATRPIWYYLPILVIGMFPVSLFLPSLFRYLTTRKVNSRFIRTREHGFLMIAAIWTFVVFSLIPEKSPSFVLPVVPLLCLLVGWLVDSSVFACDCRLPHWLKTAPRILTVLLFCLFVGLQLTNLFWFETGIGSSILVAAVLAAVCCVTVEKNPMSKTAWVGLASIAIAFSAFTSLTTLRAIEQPLRTSPAIEQAISRPLSIAKDDLVNGDKTR